MSLGKDENSDFSILPPGVPLKISIGVRRRPLAVAVKAHVTLFVLLVDFLMCIVCFPISSSVLLALKVKGTGVWSMFIM
jgi:hypothetical protein